MIVREDLLICTACGTQFDVPASEPLESCFICDDPRQFVPPQGQTWTSLSQMHGNYKNVFKQDAVEERMWSISTEPKFGIGQRAILLETAEGNVLWDCIAYIDDETIATIKGKGGLKAIVISHPHYYTTHLDWARAFDCRVYLAAEDETWLSQTDAEGRRKFIQGTIEEIMPGVIAAKPGGHFPGSLVLLWNKMLMIADTLLTVPSALCPRPGTTSYAFMWSIPNFIPLPPSEMYKMWQTLKSLDFESTHGAFVGTEVREKNVKARVLESMKIQTRGEGYSEHEILSEQLP